MNNDLEQFSEERLIKLSGEGSYYAPTWDERKALAHIALAVKQAKPVGYFVHTLEDGVRGMTSIPDDSPLVKVATPLYTTPHPAHTEQDGWKLVPIEPTEEMVINGFESEPDETFSPDEEWEAYKAMSGCEQAAHRAKLCWQAMLAAVPKPESD